MYIYILQPGRVIFTNHTKRNNNKSRIVPDFWFPTELQRRSQSETDFAAGLYSVVSRSPTGAPHVRAGASMCPTGIGCVGTEGVSRTQPALLDSVLVEPAEALGKVPAQRDREDVEEDEQSEGVEQRRRVLQEGQRWRERKEPQICDREIHLICSKNGPISFTFINAGCWKWNGKGLTVVPQECDVEIITDGDQP